MYIPDGSLDKSMGLSQLVVVTQLPAVSNIWHIPLSAPVNKVRPDRYGFLPLLSSHVVSMPVVLSGTTL